MAEEATRKTFYLFDEDLAIINQVAERFRVKDSAALRIILTQWKERDAAQLVDMPAPYSTEPVPEET